MRRYHDRFTLPLWSLTEPPQSKKPLTQLTDDEYQDIADACAGCVARHIRMFEHYPQVDESDLTQECVMHVWKNFASVRKAMASGRCKRRGVLIWRQARFRLLDLRKQFDRQAKRDMANYMPILTEDELQEATIHLSKYET